MITIKVSKSDTSTDGLCLYISFPFNPDVIAKIKSLPVRYWVPERKAWEVPYAKLETVLNLLSDYKCDVVYDEEADAYLDEQDEIDDFDFKTEPFKHQKEGFYYGMTHNKWLLGDEQGLGKTKQVIDIAIARKHKYGYKHCLIICGVNGLKWNWLNEIAVHSNESGYIIGQRIKKNKLVIGSTQDKLYDLMHLESIPNYFLITNIESLRNEQINAILSESGACGDIGMIACDEIHKCKNPSSQQGKGLLKLKADTMIAMSGTPLMNSPLDLYIILKWLGVEKHSFYAFKNHFCVMGGYGGYEIVGYRYLDDLQDTVNSLMLRRLKEDVLDLPDKQYIDEFVDMTKGQASLYKEVLSDMQANIDKIILSPNPLSQLLRLRQVTGDTSILSTSVNESAKLDRLEDIIEEAVANNRKVVIFSNWSQVVNSAYQRLSKNYRGVVITGDTADTERQWCVNQFQELNYINFIIGTIGAMGTGLTLTAGTIVVFLDEPWTMANKQQAIDRCHRIGTKDNITVYTMMCKDTIDERIHSIVEQKGAMSDALIDGKIMGDKLQTIQFLLS